MKSLFNLLIMTICCGLYSCIPRGEDDCEKKLYLSDELKDYMLHPVGSYWVYQDSASRKLDTITVVSNESGFWLVQDFCVNTEFKIEYLYSSLDQKEIKSVFSINPSSIKDENSTHIYTSGYKSGVFVSSVSQSHPIHDYNSHFLGFYSTLKLNEQEYKDVRHFENVTFQHQDNQFEVVLYIAKGIGYIRKEYNNGEVWNLIDYKVD